MSASDKAKTKTENRTVHFLANGPAIHFARQTYRPGGTTQFRTGDRVTVSHNDTAPTTITVRPLFRPHANRETWSQA